MKDLSNFEAVKAALTQVQMESDVNNGTQGLKFFASFWQQEAMYDKDRNDLRSKLARAVLKGELAEVTKLQAEMVSLPKPKIMMIFKLTEPIKRLMGTKKIVEGDVQYKLSMNNVEYLYISEDSINLKLLEYQETDMKDVNSLGGEEPILEIHLKKGLIDVAQGVQSRDGREFLPKRAMVTPVSYSAMQVAGELMNREEIKKRRRYGFDQV